jgi:hypothetical protein
MVRLRILCLVGLLLSVPGHSDTLEMDGMNPADTQSRPARGMSMNAVEQAYGTPANRQAPVGEPPITRWEYAGFTVYFEHRYVIHSVVSR